MKKLYNISTLIFILFLSYNVNSQEDILSKLKEIAFVDQKVMMPMRDGIRLATDVYRPKTDEKVPIIFQEPLITLTHGLMEKKKQEHINLLTKL